MTDAASIRERLDAVWEVSKYRPKLAAGIVALSLVSAVLEGIGLSFLLPIIETAQTDGTPPKEGLVGIFIEVYQFLGIPFTLEFIIAGVSVVMVARYSSSFLTAWLRGKLRTEYQRDLQRLAFDGALEAKVSYFDEHGSDEILNSIVTEAGYASQIINRVVNLLQQTLMSLTYIAVAVSLAPVFTLATGLILGGVLAVLRFFVESGYDVGDRVADANERLQTAVQAGTQGIRDVKLFGLTEELRENFWQATAQHAESSIKLRRNEAALYSFYQLATALTVFLLIYFAFRFTDLTLAGLGVFLFAMFRLAPRVSSINNVLYQLESDLPHLIRTQAFLESLDDVREPDSGNIPVPTTIEELRFEEVSFSYSSDEQVIRDISFAIKRGEFVAFVGPSGAGKSTLVSLITRMYDSDSGVILTNGNPITEFPIDDWRERISVVRQNPYIFNRSLRYNITVGNRDVSQADIERVSEIARVTEFLDELPRGYDTVLGDEGVKLSGGQRQRVSIARALLKDADLLLLDEATSDLDSNIEQEVHRAIESMDRDYAMLVIAHRLSTVVNADRIYTMSDGRIEESGPHGKLVEQNGTYANLYATQTQNR